MILGRVASQTKIASTLVLALAMPSAASQRESQPRLEQQEAQNAAVKYKQADTGPLANTGPRGAVRGYREAPLASAW